jgi:hypothetical protein
MTTIGTALAVAVFLVFKNKKDYQSITYYDGCFFEKNTDAEYYFVKRLLTNTPIARESNVGLKKESNNDPNTTRELNNNEIEMANEENNEHKEKQDNIIVLKENDMQQEKLENEIIVNNNFLNKTVDKVPSEHEIVAQQNDTELRYRGITYHDYAQLAIINNHYDKRAFPRYVKDELIQNHSILRLVMKRSLVEPYYVNIVKLILKINLIFGANAICFIDSYIDSRADNPSRVTKY